jgi:hypothetical protein
VGYKNGLKLNADLAMKDNWTIEDITQPTDRLTKLAFSFSLEAGILYDG